MRPRSTKHAGLRGSGAAALLLVTSCVMTSRPVRAEDWLAVFPTCAQGRAVWAPGAMRVLYPRDGLPAIVATGDVLIARVRVPSGLTPPPGVQQDRALRAWSATLVRDAFGAGASSGSVRLALRVIDIRPDAAATAIYRASIPIPTWVAPGTYDLRLTAPGGEATVLGAVRVIHDTAVPRLAWDGGDPPAALAAAEIDTWVSERALHAAAGALPAYLDAHVRDVALRVGRELWVFGGCDDAAVAFEDQVSAVARAESRRVVRLDAALLRARLPVAHARAPSVQRCDAASCRVAAASEATVRTEVVWRVPFDGRPVAIDGPDGLALYPARALDAQVALDALLAIVHVAPAETVFLRVRSAPRTQGTLTVTPREALARRPVDLAIEGAGTEAAVLWSFGEERSARGRRVRTVFAAPGEHHVEALVLGAHGTAQRFWRRIVVQPERTGCAAVPSPRDTAPSGAELPLLLVLWHIRRRKRE